jgi:hypothetical protein
VGPCRNAVGREVLEGRGEMKRIPRFLVAVGVVALSAAVTGPLSVHAADFDHDVVVFTGHILTGQPVPLIGGPAIPYVFAQTGCAITSSDVEVPGVCNLATGGNYLNIACGTGNVPIAGAALREPDGTVDNIAYNLVLAGGVGVVGGGEGNGVVDIVPNPLQPTPPAGTCGNDFLIEGTVVTS